MIGKKLTAGALALVLGASLFAPVASAQTSLQDQYNALMQQLLALQAQLNSGSNTVSFQFTRNLTVGSVGDDVRELQKFLNSKGFVVSTTGVGSVGNETTYFGAKTRIALAKFQAANGIAPAVGYFGPATRAKISAMIVVVIPPVVTPTSTPTTTPTTTPPTTPGVEGTLTGKVYASPVGVEIREGNKDKAVMAYEFEAKTSAITIQRIDVNAASNISEDRPWIVFERMSLTSGGSVIATKQLTSSDDFTKETDGSYTVRFSGLNEVVAKDSKKVITVTLSARDSISDTNKANVVWTLQDGYSTNKGVRGVDGAGIQHEIDVTGTRTFTVKADTAGDLEVSLNSANKDSQVVFVNESSNESDVELLAFNVKAKETNVTINSVSANVATSTGSTSSPVVAVKLYNGSTLVGTETMTAGTSTVTFDDLDLPLSKDATANMYIKVDVLNAGTNNSNYAAGATVSATVTRVSYEDSLDNPEATEYVSIAGNSMYLWVKAPVVNGGTKETLTYVGDATALAQGNLVFTVTAQGGDIYLNESTTTLAISGSSTVAAEGEWSVSGATETSSGSNIWRITSGATATITIPVIVDVASNGFYKVELDVLDWSTDGTTATDVQWTQGNYKPVDNVETNTLYVTGS